MIKIELSEQDLSEWTGRLDAITKAGGLAVVPHVAFFIGKIEEAFVASKQITEATTTTNDRPDQQM